MTDRQKGWLLPPCAALLAGGILWGRSSDSLIPALGGIALACCAMLLLRGWGRYAAALALSLCVGCAAGSHAFHPTLPPEGIYTVSGVVTEEVRVGAYGRRSIQLGHVTLNGEPFSAGAYWTFYTDETPEGLTPGCQVTFLGELYHPSGESNPDEYNFREELLRRGITIGVYGAEELVLSEPAFFSFPGQTAALRHRLTEALLSRMGEEAGGYAATLLLGGRSLIPSEDRAAFSRLGIAHLLAVSGFHVGVLVSALAWLFRRLRLPQGLRLGLYAALLLGYSALCGMNQPVLRASLLLLLSQRGRMLARPRSTLHLLSAAFILLLLISPAQITGISFQMTFGAVLGIALIAPTLQGWLTPTHPWLRSLWTSTCVTLSAELGALLPVLSTYQSLPLLGLVTNLPAMALGSLLIGLDWVALLCLPIPILSDILASAATAVTEGFVSGVRVLGSVPGITLWTHTATGWTVLGVVLLFVGLCRLLRWNLRARLPVALAGVCVIALSLIPWHHGGTEYIQFSVGNADGAVLWDEDAVWVLDTSMNDGVVSGFLRRNRLTPEAVVLTHLHMDHAGGLQSLLDDEIPVPVIYLPEGAEQAAVNPDILRLLDRFRAAGTEVRTLARGDALSLPSGGMEVIWPERGKVRPWQDANESSLVSLWTLHGVTLLQTGDLDGTYEAYAAVAADVLKMAHHGSKGSTSEAFLAAVDPRVILLSCRQLSREKDVRERVGNIPLYATASGGALTLRFAADSWSVASYLDTSGRED